MSRVQYFLPFLMISIISACTPVQKSFLTYDKAVRISEPSTIKADPCKQWESYVPDTSRPAEHPVRYVKVNIHIMNNTAGTANFNEEEGRDYAHDLIYSANQRLMNNKPMNLPVGNNTPVLPANVRFVITPDPSIPGDDGIYFHFDDSLYFVNNQDKFRSLFDATPYEKYGIQKGEVINIFMHEHPLDSADSPTYKLAANGVGTRDWLKMVSAYQKNSELYYMDGDVPIYKGAWHIAGLFNHEILHTLGLAHSWSGHDGCPDTPAHPNCWNHTDEPPCDKGVSNNMMDYNQESNALTPCQIAKVQANLARDGFQRKYVRKDWCVIDPAKEVNIFNGDSIFWNGSKDIMGNIVIHKGGYLEIICKVSMPQNAKIIVKPGATLVLNDALIDNTCGGEWQGIEIWEKKKNKGTVVFKNGMARLLNVKNKISEGE